MRLIRRLSAALFSVLLLQLTLLGSGTLCAMHGGGSDRMRPHDMRAMNPTAPTHADGGITAQRGSLPDASPASPSSCDGRDAGNDCGLPWAPGQCASMANCTVTAAPVMAVVALTAASHPAPMLAERASAGSRAAAAPELPPPRA